MKFFPAFTKSNDKETAKVVANKLLGIKEFHASLLEDGDSIVSGELKLECHVSAPHSARCHPCNSMIADGKMAYVLSGTLVGDTIESLIARYNRSRGNNSASVWCIPCVLKLIKKGGGQEPTIEKKPEPPKPVPLTPQEIADRKLIIQAYEDKERRKHELARALEHRVLTADEIREVADHGEDIYVHMYIDENGHGGSSQSYKRDELRQRLLTAWQIQTNLRMAETATQPKEGNNDADGF